MFGIVCQSHFSCTWRLSGDGFEVWVTCIVWFQAFTKDTLVFSAVKGDKPAWVLLELI